MHHQMHSWYLTWLLHYGNAWCLRLTGWYNSLSDENETTENFTFMPSMGSCWKSVSNFDLYELHNALETRKRRGSTIRKRSRNLSLINKPLQNTTIRQSIIMCEVHKCQGFQPRKTLTSTERREFLKRIFFFCYSWVMLFNLCIVCTQVLCRFPSLVHDLIL